ncbi:hypothetical protein [Bacillus toyonensis]|uniref:Uncharacterized protein n=1 Tax=uncultured Caudovirales phage TaxID=2100421 RepID=A0A2H4J9X9_9CAUD|nr:hypothetical protein [Bacillus toyonensis]ASN71439.1 hypothetical protein 3F9_32 [uncultured Caudovirales phage]MDR4969781.1 hypothetical protein [Bacillus toyonensis]
MARQYGYCYDKDGHFTEMIPLEEKAITEKQTFYREEIKEIVTEEKLCELHQSVADGTYNHPEDAEEPISKYDCPNCVMRNVEYETIKVPYEEDVIVGYEPNVPANCTLEPCPDLIFEPVFKDGKWVKLKPDLPPQPPEEPSELEQLKKKTELIQKALDELIMG